MFSLSKRIAVFLAESLKVHADDRDIYIYCFQYLINNGLYLIIMLFIGLLSGNIAISVIYLLVLYPLRMFGGGAHAASRIRCIFISYGIGLMVILLGPVVVGLIDTCCIFALFCAASILFILLAPVDTANKRLSESHKLCLRRQCRKVILLVWVLYIVFSIHSLKMCYGIIMLCVMICAINLLIGTVMNLYARSLNTDN